MNNILINGAHAKSGGGKIILDSFIEQVCRRGGGYNWFIIVDRHTIIRKYKYDHLTYISVASSYLIGGALWWLYNHKIPRIIKDNNINIILNFGDMIIPRYTNQIYFFDWAYAFYNYPYIWNNMTVYDYLVRKTKVILIKKLLKNVRMILVQTENIENRIKCYDKNLRTKVIPTPVNVSQCKANVITEEKSNQIKYYLVPTSYSTHKNLEILLHVSKLIDVKNKPYKIIVTIDKNKHTSKFLKKIAIDNLKSLECIGYQSHENLIKLYSECDALLLPTLLESYGLPYFEAMAHGIPILTSDLDFAHAACGEAAIYFDPFKAQSICDKMDLVYSNNRLASKCVNEGFKKLNTIPSWDEWFITVLKVIKRELSKSK